MRFRPALLVVLTFGGLILAGFVVLRGFIHPGGQAETDVIKSGFTAVSAVCMTGLSVVDLSRDS